MPVSRVERALCLAGGELRESIRAIEGTDIARVDDTPGHDTARVYDLVLASNVEPETLAIARRTLRPGGLLCAEGSAASVGGGQRILRRVRGEGFSRAELIVRWDVRGDERAWIPLSSRVARRHFFLRHPLPARHALRRLWLTSRRRVGMTFHSSGWCGEFVLVAQIDALPESELGSGSSNVTPWWVRACETATGHRSPRDWLLLTPGCDAEAKAVGFVFGPATHGPAVAVKFGRTPAAVERIARGFSALEELHEFVTTRGLAPAPVARLADDSGRPAATVESAIDGRSLDGALRGHNLEHFTNAMTDWLMTLAVTTRRSPPGNLWQSLFQPTVDRFNDLATGLVDDFVLRDANAIIREARSMPTVFEHHDLAPWNIYVQPNGRLVALDWDNACHDGLPAFDLFQCHAYLAFAIDGAWSTRRFASSHRARESGPLGRVRRACVTRYANAIGLSDTELRAVRAFAWMRLAADEIQARRAASSPLGRDALEYSLFGLWESEARQALTDRP